MGEGLDLLMQALTQPAFAQDRLDLAKRQARQRISRRNDDVTSIANYEMKYLLYGENFFASADDTRESQEAITRDDLVAFHARQLHPANLFVAASGQFDRKAMIEALNRTVGSIKAGPQARISPAVPTPDFPRSPGIFVTDKDAPQAMVRWVFPGIRRTDPDWYAGFVANQILGGRGFTSRLMKKIRSDEGLTYAVYSTLEPGTYWRGDVTGSMQTKNRSVAFALRLALEEIRKGGLTPEECIRRAKDKSNPFRLYGFGHRIYKNYDPRAKIIKEAADQVFEVTGRNPLLDIAIELERIALEDDYFVKRKLYPNVDFYSGIIYQAMGFPVEMFPSLFAIGRTPGWCAQWEEGLLDPEQKITRPRQLYDGEPERHFVAMGERG